MRNITLILISFLFTACASTSLPDTMTSQIPSDREQYEETVLQNIPDVPDWVLRGNGAMDDGLIYGVGSISGMRNISLAISAADDRARAEVVKVIQMTTSALNKDYQSGTTAGDFTNSQDEQLIEQAIKTFTHATVSGIVIVDHWQNPKQNQIFSLARLDTARLQEEISKYQGISKQLQEAIRERAETLHQELNERIERENTALDGEIELRQKRLQSVRLEKQIEDEDPPWYKSKPAKRIWNSIPLAATLGGLYILGN